MNTRCQAPRASTFARLSFGTAFRANLADGFVNDALHLVEFGVGVAGLDVLNGAMEYPPTDRVFDELGQVAPLHTPGTQEGAQGEVGFLGDLDVPANRLLSSLARHRHTGHDSP